MRQTSTAWDLELPPTEKLVLLAITDPSARARDVGQLVERTGITRATVVKLVRRLQDKDLLEEEIVTTPARETAEPDEFRELRSIYPRRAGTHRWPEALRACRARIREGSSWREILDGARRYALFVRETDKEGTEYVMQAATFVGKNRGFLEPWRPPEKKRSAIEKLLRPEACNGMVQR